MFKHDPKRSKSGHVGGSIQQMLDGIARESGDTALSTAIANLLEPLDFEVHVAKSSVGRAHDHDLRYVLTVHHRGAQTMWKHHRSFDEYETFQRRVLDELHHGHLCSGGCPWLESFIRGAFETTKRSIGAELSTVVERRRKTTLDVMQTHKRFLIDRANHTCTYTLHRVARVYIEFIYGGVMDSSHVMDEFLHTATITPPAPSHEDRERSSSMTKKAQRRLQSHSSSMPVGEGILAKSTTSPSPPAAEDAQLTALRHSFAKSEANPDKCAICENFMPVKDIYIVRLGCGHRFHDECALPKLNQKLQCPTCHTDLTQFS